MRYLRVVEDQGRYVASLPETLPPTPTRGEVLIRVTASGVNRADLSQIAGRYPPPAGESEILGLEVSGTLDETGEPVCALLAGGGHAECVAAPVGQVFPAPAGLDLVTAAGIPEAFLTAFVNLIVEGGLDLALLMRKRARIVGSTLRARSRLEKAAIVARFKEELLPRFTDGALRVVVDSVFPVARAAEAFQRMRENRNAGKILIAWRRD